MFMAALSGDIQDPKPIFGHPFAILGFWIHNNARLKIGECTYFYPSFDTEIRSAERSPLPVTVPTSLSIFYPTSYDSS